MQVDGLYDADEYADMMRGVDMDPGRLAAKPGDVRTNCTTRFGAKHSIRTEGVYRHIASVFIPYGTLVFACFQTTKCYELPLSSGSDAWAAAATAVPPATVPAVPAPPPAIPPIAPPPPSTRDWRQEYDYGYTDYPYSGYDPAAAAAGVAPFHARLNETATPPRVGGGTTRPLVRPPGDVDKCRGCGTRESPEWRKGENGVKDLCNACGLKLARAVAKREGRQKPRKKDKI